MSSAIVRIHIGLLLLGFLISAFGLVSVILFTDPNNSGWIVHASLYLTLFLTVITAATIFGILIRSAFFYGLYAANLKISIRQAILLGLLLCISLLLLSYGLLIWWVFLLLLSFTIALEIFFNL